MSPTDEVGRELQINELRERTVVFLNAEHRPRDMVSMWVSNVGQDFVAFYGGEVRMTFIAYLREDGTLADDAGRRIRVFEYLGEI